MKNKILILLSLPFFILTIGLQASNMDSDPFVKSPLNVLQLISKEMDRSEFLKLRCLNKKNLKKTNAVIKKFNTLSEDVRSFKNLEKAVTIYSKDILGDDRIFNCIKTLNIKVEPELLKKFEILKNFYCEQNKQYIIIQFEKGLKSNSDYKYNTNRELQNKLQENEKTLNKYFIKDYWNELKEINFIIPSVADRCLKGEFASDGHNACWSHWYVCDIWTRNNRRDNKNPSNLSHWKSSAGTLYKAWNKDKHILSINLFTENCDRKGKNIVKLFDE